MSDVAMQHPATARYAEYINPAFVKLLGTFGFGRVFTRARGCLLWDASGRRYVDFLAGFGATNLGHSPPRLIARLQRALGEELPNVMHVGPQAKAGELGEALSARVPELPMCLLSCSGGEAVEAAMKLARAATGRSGIVHCHGGFHGTGLGNLSIMGHARWQRPFVPLLPNCYAVPFGDLDALARVLARRKIAAFVVEPVQGEAGAVRPPEGYLLEAARLCRSRGALFVLDEVQTGLGRCGRRFAFEHTRGLCPDVLVLGKSLGGGLLPISATLTTRAIQQRAYGTVFKFDLHGSTFSGNALGCIAAMETLRIIDDDDLPARAERLGQRLLSGLRRRTAGHPFVRDVRGLGLLVGLELGPTGAGALARLAPSVVELVSRQVFGQWLALELLERGFLCQPASQSWNVLKVTPPLTIEEAEVDAFVEEVGQVLDRYRELTPLLGAATRRITAQLRNGGAFG